MDKVIIFQILKCRKLSFQKRGRNVSFLFSAIWIVRKKKLPALLDVIIACKVGLRASKAFAKIT